MVKKKVFQISNALTEGLEQTISAAHRYAGDLRIDVIPIHRIALDAENPRKLALTITDVQSGVAEQDPQRDQKLSELENLKTLANSIREQGLIHPILVFKCADHYQLIAGERRTLATIMAGKDDIQAKILDAKPSELKVSLLQWIENVERSDLTLWERLSNLEKIINHYAAKKNLPPQEVTITEISQLIGCSKSQALNYKAALFADETIKLFIQQNKFKNLEKTAFIANIKSDPLRKTLIQSYLSGASYKKLKWVVTQEARRQNQVELPSRRRGRQASFIQLGATKNMKVAKVIFDAVTSEFKIKEFDRTTINWNDYQAVSESFKILVKSLEKIYS